MTKQTTIKFPTVKEQLKRIKGSVVPAEIVSEGELAERLDKSRVTGEPLRIKQGFDATAPDLHIGHAVSLWKLKTFQDLGHTVIFLIGDYTAMVGDPSGKSKTRPTLTRKQVAENAKTYCDQVGHILETKKIEIRFNSEWHSNRNIYEFLDLCSRYTVRRMLERDDFWKRFTAEQPISMLEFLYPLLQSYDSVELQADIELGGTDQRFNLMLARHIQRAYGQEPQVLLFMPLLRGTDGSEKMSKSLGNTIGITDPPEEIYGKIMSIPDELLWEYTLSASGMQNEQLSGVLSDLKSLGLDRIESPDNPDALKLPKGVELNPGSRNADPYLLKQLLAKQVVTRYCGNSEVAEEVCQQFLSRFRDHEWPSFKKLLESESAVQIDQKTEWLPRIIVQAGAAKSNGEAQRLIKAGAVAIDRVKVDDNSDRWDITIDKPFVMKVGKRRFFAVYNDEEQLTDIDRHCDNR